jgi:hypothetical protein
MALQTSGIISIDDIRVELNKTGTTSLQDTDVRGLVDKNQGETISLDDFYGAENIYEVFVTADALNLNVSTYAVANGWDGTTPLLLTVNAGVWLYSNSTSTAGLIIPSSMNGLLTLVNNGNIIGDGGAPNAAGGDAISNSATGVSITNNSGAYIAGGGGGGGGTFTFTSVGYPGTTFTAAYGGGGAGQDGALGSTATTSGGHGWRGIATDSTIGHSCSGPTNTTNSLGANPARGYGYGGGGGSGAFAGQTSFVYTSGSCAGRLQVNNYYYNGASGGRALTGGSTGTASGNAGGFWGQSGSGGGGAGGAAVSGTTVTITNNGTVYGTIA